MNARPDGELQVLAAGQIVTTWQSVSVTRSVEHCPSTWSVQASSKDPREVRSFIPVGAPAVLTIGGHPVLSGYLERLTTNLADGRHTVTYSGRGKCCDLVDCSALISSMTRMAVNISDLARELIAPFADGTIDLLLPDGEGDQRYFQYSVNLGETPYAIIERYARYEGLMAYEDALGRLVLSRVGHETHRTGLVEGRNIQAFQLVTSQDQRFSIYIPLQQATDTLTRDGSIGGRGNEAGQRQTDPGVKRYRPRVVVSEMFVEDTPLAELRARWEANRRYGRSFVLNVTVDSWLDGDGIPWTPNMLAPVEIPSLRITADLPFIIASVTYNRDGHSGTTASLVLMPPQALAIQPTALNPLEARRTTPRGGVGDNSNPNRPPTAPNGLRSEAAGRAPALNAAAGLRSEAGQAAPAPATPGLRGENAGATPIQIIPHFTPFGGT